MSATGCWLANVGWSAVEIVANRIRRERSDRRLRREKQKQRQGRAAGADTSHDGEARELLAASSDSSSGEEPQLNESVGLASTRHGARGVTGSDDDSGFGTATDDDENASSGGAAAAATAAAQAREQVSIAFAACSAWLLTTAGWSSFLRL